jgi:hypothetical protein
MRVWEVIKEAHKHMDMYFSYLVAASVTLQASWDQMDTYIPVKWRHIVIGSATAIVIFDRMRKAIESTKP